MRLDLPEGFMKRIHIEQEVSMLTRELVKEALYRALATGADYAEVYAEHTRSKTINNISGKTDKI